jgi:hypothetical protein
LRCNSPEGHNFYNRHANGLRQKIKMALLPFSLDSYDESLAFQLALHTAYKPKAQFAVCNVC